MDPSSDSDLSIGEVRAILAKLHHDLNNPLSVIAGNAQLLLEVIKGTDAEQQLKEPLKDIQQASERLQQKVNEVDQLKETLDEHSS